LSPTDGSHVALGQLEARKAVFLCANALASIAMIRKLKSGLYRLNARTKNPTTGKRHNLGTFKMRDEALKHERAVQFFKRR